MQSFFRESEELEGVKKLKALSSAEKECLLAWKQFDVIYDVKHIAPDAIWDMPYTRPDPPKNPKEIANWGLEATNRKFPYYTKEYKKRMEERMKPNHPPTQ